MNTTSEAFRWANRARDTVAHAGAPQPTLIRLGGGLAFPPELPDVTAEAIAAAKNPAEGLQYGPLYGLNDMRDAVVRYLADDGVKAERDNILIVNGAKNGLELALRVFAEKGDTVIVTSPTYLTAIAIMRTHEVNFLQVSQDGDGMRVDELEGKLRELRRRGATLPKLLFDVPDFHNPTGITMSESRRRRLVELAVEFEFRILEDDPYRRVRFEGASIPPIKSFDIDGHVIGLGTVSKILAPGLRIGWVNAVPQILRRMAAQKADHGTNPFVQRVVAQLLQSGKVDHHIEQIKSVQRIHRDTMLDAIKRHLPEAKVASPAGGYFLWVELPKVVDSDELVQRAAAYGVETFSGKLSFAQDAPKNFLRLAYSYASLEEIERGIAALGVACAELISGKASSITNGGGFQVEVN